MQDDRVSIQASDGEFRKHYSLEAIFFDPKPDMESKWQPQEAISNYITKCLSKKSKYEAIHENSIKDTGILLINNFVSAVVHPQILAADKVQNSKKKLQRGTIISRTSLFRPRYVNNCIFPNDKIMG